MSYESVVKEDSPKGYWRLGESSGTEAKDSSGNAQNGTYKNAPTLGVAGALVGDADTATRFATASKQWVSVPDSANLDLGDTLTYEAWVKRASIGTTQTIIDRGAGALIVRFLATNKILVRRNEVANICESTTTITDTTTWHHIVVTKTGATVKIYIDGVDVTGAVTNSTLVNNAHVLGIGAADGDTVEITEWFDGSIDEVAVYGTALSAARVKAHFLAGSSAPVTVPMGSSAGSSSTFLALRTPTAIPLGPCGGSASTSVALRVPTQIPLGPSAGISSTAISLKAPLVVALGPSGGASTTNLALSGKTQIPLGLAKGQGTTALSLRAKALLTLASAGQAGGALVVTAPLVPNRIRVTERPPMRQHVLVTAPNGRTERWGEDELEVAKVISDLSSSSSAPGGCKDFSCALPRKPGVDYADMKPGSKIEEYGAGNYKVGEYRLERTPRTSGDYLVMDPAASGYQVLLTDDEGAREIFIDSDESGWGDVSTQRRLDLLSANVRLTGSTNSGWQGSGTVPPGVTFGFSGVVTDSIHTERGESYYSGAGVDIGALLVHFANLNGGASSGWLDRADLIAGDHGDELMASGSNHAGATDSNLYEEIVAGGSGRKYIRLTSDYNDPASGTSMGDLHSWERPKVLGLHGLTLRGTWPEVGFLASDVIPYLLSRFAPGLHYTTGPYGTIKPSSFVIPHLVFKEPTTVLDMLTTILSYELLEWGVWPGQFGPTFYLNQRGQREGRKRWRTRIRPAKFTETGQQMDQVWNRVVMSWTDFDGTLKTMGPVGSGYPLTDARCEDTDPQNLINQADAQRTKHLTLDGPGTAEGAAEKARLFLEKVKLLDGSGEATLTGYVEDEHGAEWPYYCVDATHEIEFIDSSIPGYRYVVEANPTRSSRSVKVKIDAPPDSYEAILSELQVRETARNLG